MKGEGKEWLTVFLRDKYKYYNVPNYVIVMCVKKTRNAHVTAPLNFAGLGELRIDAYSTGIFFYCLLDLRWYDNMSSAVIYS